MQNDTYKIGKNIVHIAVNEIYGGVYEIRME